MDDISKTSIKAYKNSKTSSKSSVSKKSFLKSKSSRSSEEKSELSVEDERLFIVSSIRHSIVESALDIIYEKYLEKQTVFFVSYCSQLAWKSLIDWKYQRKDPGGFQMMKSTEDLDQEPEPSPKDSWAGKSIPFAVEENTHALPTVKRQTATTSTITGSEIVDAICSAEVENSVSFVVDRTATVKKARSILDKGLMKGKNKSLEFSTLLLNNQDRSNTELKKESYELPSPIFMPAKKFPPSRVDVSYNITPGVRGLVSRKPPTVKKIFLHKPKHEGELIPGNNN